MKLTKYIKLFSLKFFLAVLLFVFSIQPSFCKENINVAFTIDNNYPIFTLIVINSILENNTSNSDYTFYIIENDITPKNKAKMTQYVEKRNQKIKFINLDTKIIDNGDYLYGFSNRISPIAMARILLPEILPKDVHKVLYLDADILVTADLLPLYQTDIKKYPVAMVENIIDLRVLGPYILKQKRYYNSGVILMNLDLWRKEKISDKMLKFVQKHKDNFIIVNDLEDNLKFYYPDQDMINIVLDRRIKTLNKRWNNQTLRNVEEKWQQSDVAMDDKEDYEKMILGGIIHYLGPNKPWTFPVLPDDTLTLYSASWNRSGLWIYKFYYFPQNLKNNYRDIASLKLFKYLRIVNKKFAKTQR